MIIKAKNTKQNRISNGARKLRIATMVTGHFVCPQPEGIIYAPMDIARWVSEGLSQKGHLVDFYAPTGSKLAVNRIVSGGLKALQQNGGGILKTINVGDAESHKIFNLWDQYLIALMFQAAAAGQYDILHIHPADRALPLTLSHLKVPTVYTLHDPIYPWRAEIFKMFQSPNQYFVSISDAQRKPAPDLNYLATIHNGIDLSLFPFAEASDDYFVFVGRLHLEKGVAEAVAAARQAGAKLLIIGPPVTGDYWDRQIKPYLNDRIKYVGHVPYNELFRYYQKAKAILVPIQWEEPFGLVMIEAMACGAPVIAFRKGSVPEVVIDGKTGFIVNTVGEMAKAMNKIAALNRKDCRDRVKSNFSLERMIDRYEEEFSRLIK